MAGDPLWEDGRHVAPRILFIDAYDSFSNSIVSLLGSVLNAQVKIVKMDELDTKDHEFQSRWHLELSHFDAVVCGPGPGSAVVWKDVGLMNEVWKLDDENRLPVLGICLGFQSLIHAHGGKIRKLKEGLHGMVRSIQYRRRQDGVDPMAGGNIFKDVKPFKATLYHSLCADVGQDEMPSDEWARNRWACRGNIVPLAWIEEPRDNGSSVERVLMAAKHATRPFWGLQYHPESVCTSANHSKVLRNWMAEALQWNVRNGRTRADTDIPPRHQWHQTPSQRDSLLQLVRNLKASGNYNPQPWMQTSGLARMSLQCRVHIEKHPISPGAKLEDIVEFMVDDPEKGAIVLDSSNCAVQLPRNAADVRGRYSIIALDVDKAPHFEHWAGTSRIRAYIPTQRHAHANANMNPATEFFDFSRTHGSFWQWASDFRDSRLVSTTTAHKTPFYGGFMGVVSYEMGLHDIGIAVPDRSGAMVEAKRPDICWVWVTKSLIVDHRENAVYLQFLRPRSRTPDATWRDTMMGMTREEGEYYTCTMPKQLSQLRSFLDKRALWRAVKVEKRPLDTADAVLLDESNEPPIDANIHLPSATQYQEKVARCQHFIKEGQSYELCLTDEAIVTRPRVQDLLNKSGPDLESNGTGGGSDIGNDPKSGGGGSSGTVWGAKDDDDVDYYYEMYYGDTNEDESGGGSDESEKSPLPSPSPSPVDRSPSPPPPRNTGENEKYSELDTAWDLYVRLRNLQPAPFGSYMRLGCGLTVISSSPERFLSYCSKGLCTMRPMKGTVKKTPQCTTLSQAESVLRVPKEEAENLMIVDLVRHDLYGVCGTGRVSVPHLLKVEEYASVFQMVSIVHGLLPPPFWTADDQHGPNRDYTGLDALTGALPPGSMTGAPKKRSCEILEDLEKRERGVYSGVIGYHCITGQGDWSVNIRCMFKWDDECGCIDGRNEDGEACHGSGVCQEGEKWHVGAGGAVTVLSTPEGETQEMFTKLEGTLKIFKRD